MCRNTRKHRPSEIFKDVHEDIGQSTNSETMAHLKGEKKKAFFRLSVNKTGRSDLFCFKLSILIPATNLK